MRWFDGWCLKLGPEYWLVMCRMRRCCKVFPLACCCRGGHVLFFGRSSRMVWLIFLWDVQVFFGMSVKWKNTGILEYPNYLHITDIGYCLGYPFYWHSNIGIPQTLEYSKHRGVMSPRHYIPWRLACQEWGAGQNGRSQDFFGPSLCGEGHHFNTS